MLSCTLTEKSISVILPGKNEFSLLTQIATFSVLADDQLGRADFISKVISTDEAVAKIHEICNAYNLSSAGLGERISNSGGVAPALGNWNTRGNVGNILINVTLDRLTSSEAKVYVTLDWKREGIPPKFPTTPMKPPAGYENVSMYPPGVNPNQQGFPSHDMQYYKDVIAKKKTEEGNSPPIVAPTSTVDSSQIQSVSKPNVPLWRFGIGIMIALGILVVLWYRLRQKH